MSDLVRLGNAVGALPHHSASRGRSRLRESYRVSPERFESARSSLDITSPFTSEDPCQLFLIHLQDDGLQCGLLGCGSNVRRDVQHYGSWSHDQLPIAAVTSQVSPLHQRRANSRR